MQFIMQFFFREKICPGLVYFRNVVLTLAISRVISIAISSKLEERKIVKGEKTCEVKTGIHRHEAVIALYSLGRQYDSHCERRKNAISKEKIPAS